MSRLLTILIPLCLHGIICSAQAHEDIYNPMAVGHQWIADVVLTGSDGQTIKGKAIREITGTETIKGKTFLKANARFEGIPGFKPFTIFQRKGPEGEWCISQSDPTKLEYLATPFPLTVGKTWEIPSEKGKVLLKVEAFEDTQVGAKLYKDCFKISYCYDSADFSSVFHLAPNVGNVKETMSFGGARMVISLREWTLKK